MGRIYFVCPHSKDKACQVYQRSQSKIPQGSKGNTLYAGPVPLAQIHKATRRDIHILPTQTCKKSVMAQMKHLPKSQHPAVWHMSFVLIVTDFRIGICFNGHMIFNILNPLSARVYLAFGYLPTKDHKGVRSYPGTPSKIRERRGKKAFFLTTTENEAID